MGNQVCGVKLMSPGGREVAPSGGEREDAGPGLLTDLHLEMRPNVTDKDKLYLLRTTSSPEVRSFLDRQPVNTKTDYQRLRKALIKEFTDPESDQGLVAALETRTSQTSSSLL